ncbi:Hint domain-containing protein [Leisingera sp. ANG-M1]|uniref:Hint domain-containing protein n=1 Tax=Leisingera sp. ANG-M1 TaxID=1577895 RepID=UPI0006896AD9|nr:Hint domain-containing protein [Leisingera sp. ANG-M1]
MANNVDFSALYLGNFADLDTNESNSDVEGRATMLSTYGSAGSPLWQEKTTLDTDSPDNYIDRDESGSDGTFTYDVGSGPTVSGLDSNVVYNGTITFADGSTSSALIDLIQLQNGDVFLIAHDDETNLDDAAIRSISLDSVHSHNYSSLIQSDFDTLEFVCFASGTAILTPAGPRPVEALRPGDLVETLDNGPQPLLWTGARHLRFPPSPDSQRPVLIQAGALGGGLPARDLAVSPQHRLLVSGPRLAARTGSSQCLAIAKSLAVLPGVRRMRGARTVSYHSLMCARHQILIAEGAPAESFYPGPRALALLSPVQRLQIAAVLPVAAGTPACAMGPLARPQLACRWASQEAASGRLQAPQLLPGTAAHQHL